MTHCTMEDLLDLRAGEGSVAARRHVELPQRKIGRAVLAPDHHRHGDALRPRHRHGPTLDPVDVADEAPGLPGAGVHDRDDSNRCGERGKHPAYANPTASRATATVPP